MEETTLATGFDIDDVDLINGQSDFTPVDGTIALDLQADIDWNLLDGDAGDDFPVAADTRFHLPVLPEGDIYVSAGAVGTLKVIQYKNKRRSPNS